MEKNNIIKKKKIIVFTPFYDPEPFPINTFVDDLKKSEEVEAVKVITSLPNYRKYGFYDNFSIIGPYNERNKKIDITRLPVIPRLSNSFISIFLFYLSFFFTSSMYLVFFSLFNRNKYNHIITFCGSPVYVGYIGYVASKLLNIPSSQWVQDIWPEAIETTIGLENKLLKKIITFFQDKMWNCSDILFAESELLSKYLKDQLPNKNVITLYNPVRKNFENRDTINSRNSEPVVFSYTGNIGKAQSLELVLEAFIKLNEDHYILNLCGNGAYLEEFSNRYNKRNIYWHGWITGRDLEEISRNTDYFILSLNSVGRQSLILPSKIQTYFQSKKPVICISEGASKELVIATNSGLTCENMTIQSVINTFTLAKSIDGEERIKMGDNGFKFYQENFMSESIVKTFIKAI